MESLMLALHVAHAVSVSVSMLRQAVRGRAFRLTQLFLKQSCEQKKLSLPSLRQLGHCSDPASFPQSTPIHFRSCGAGTSVVAIALVAARKRDRNGKFRSERVHVACRAEPKRHSRILCPTSLVMMNMCLVSRVEDQAPRMMPHRI
jgi:hypothetical protein